MPYAGNSYTSLRQMTAFVVSLPLQVTLIMPLSIFDLFKIGIGPSSSHTVGPMRAAFTFLQALERQALVEAISRVEIILYGSLAATGVGHCTDSATLLGLMGFDPETVDTHQATQQLANVRETERLWLSGRHPVRFVYQTDMTFSSHSLPYHPNAMTLRAWHEDELLCEETYYSIGGGFIVTADDGVQEAIATDTQALPYPFCSGAELLQQCASHNLSICQLMLENEKSMRPEAEIKQRILHIWSVMQECITSGIEQQGVLPGGLNIKRRAHQLHQALIAANAPNVISSTLSAMEWVNLFALAVNEENAAGGRVVTAPTNGAAGIIPAVLHYYTTFCPNACDDDVVRFFLTAGAIGILCKLNGSISGAEVGCQGEVGSACAMASGGLAEVLGATPGQVENAAEIGLEHNLGLTCDPVAGLVQVPCIERNAIAAVKAINAVQMALRGNGEHFISLDKVIQTMKDTGRDMSDKYKETSKGGLAVNAIAC